MFLSSPGDVAQEREAIANLLKDKLPYDPFLKDRYSISLVSWDDPNAPLAMPAHLSPQEAVNRNLPSPSECDAVIVVLWNRMGTPLSMDTTKEDGSQYMSGTEYEFHDALKAAKRCGQPAIFVYHKSAPTNLTLEKGREQILEMLEQRQRVEDFLGTFSNADGSLSQSYDQFQNTQELLSKIEHHLKNEMQVGMEAASNEHYSPLFDFNPPVSGDAIPRLQQQATLTEYIRSSALVAVNGISGSGKTNLVAATASNLKDDGLYNQVLWHDAEEEQSLDSFFSNLSQVVNFQGETSESRTKELVGYLATSKTLLVIDDFHKLDRRSFQPLIKALGSQSSPAKLVLTSWKFLDEVATASNGEILRIDGFSEVEVAALVKQNDLQLTTTQIRELTRRTNAHPMAVSLFCALVKNFGHSVQDLLAGQMMGADLLGAWFDEIKDQVKPHDFRLLQILAFTEIAFDRKLIERLSREVLGDYDAQAFMRLCNAFMVYPSGEKTWRVHNLVANMCQRTTEPEIFESTNSCLGRYFDELAGESASGRFSVNQIANKVRSIRFLLRDSSNHDQAGKSIDGIAQELKRRAHYELLTELTKPFVDNEVLKPSWLLYHFAHAKLILGQVDSEMMDVIESIVFASSKVLPSLRLSSTRVYCEALRQNGDLERCVSTLESVLDSSRTNGASKVSIQQARSALISALFEQRKTEEAEKQLNIYEASLKKPRPIAKGILAMHRGQLSSLKQDWSDAKACFESALDCFLKARDQRAQAWARLHLSEALVMLDDEDTAENFLVSASLFYTNTRPQDRTTQKTLLRLAAASDADSTQKIVRDLLANP